MSFKQTFIIHARIVLKCCVGSCRLLTHMLWDYRAEDWRTLLTSLLSKALSCAYLTASVREYLDLSLEALAHFPTDWQHRVLDNVLSVIKVGETTNYSYQGFQTFYSLA